MMFVVKSFFLVLLCLLYGNVVADAQVNGDVVLNEIMYHPSSQQAGEEFIELHNRGTTTINLNGWRFSKRIRFTFPQISVPAGGFLVVSADLSSFNSKYPGVTNVIGNWDGILSNSGEEILLEDTFGNDVDRVRYADEGDWAIRTRGPEDRGHFGWVWSALHDGGGRSLELINPALSNDQGQNWASSTNTEGTPGTANSVLSANIPPIITEAAHFPAVPKSTDEVITTVRVIDENPGGTKARVYYRIDGEPAFSALDMVDDGTRGDGIARDGIYVATLPKQTNNKVVEFYFEAIDSSGLVRTWPAAIDTDGRTAQLANFLYQIDDSPSSSDLPLYRIIMTEAERAELERIGSFFSEAASHAQMNGTFISSDASGTTVRYNVGVRNRGNGSRAAKPNNYRVNFPSDRQWKDVNAINLNSRYTHLQLLGSALFQKAGLPAGDSRPVRVKVNNISMALDGPPMFGFYVCNEVIDEAFAENHFPTDSSGNVYRGVRIERPGANLSYLGDEPTPYRVNYFKQSNVSEDNWRDLISLTFALSDITPETNYAASVERAINVDEWMRYFALNALLVNNETSLGSGDGDDYFLYSGRVDSRFQVIPYDLDTIFGQGDSPASAATDLFRATQVPVLNRFLKHAEFAPIYYRELINLVRTIYHPDLLSLFLRQVLGERVPPPTLEAIERFAKERSDFVLTQIPLSLSVTNDLPLTNGLRRTTSGTVNLSGSANVVETRTVLVNGMKADWIAWQGKWTTTNVNLVPGINRILVQAMDESGTEIDRASIDIWRDTNSGSKFTGRLSTNAVWTANSGPFVVTGIVTIPTNVTLTIHAGTSVFFENEAGLVVNGRLLINGTEEQRVRLTRPPGTDSSWSGIQIIDSIETNRISYADFEFSSARSNSILVENSILLIEGTTWAGTTETILELENSSLHARNCIFPSIAENETIHGNDIAPNGFMILEGNTFGTTTDYSDVIDFTGAKRPGPILQIYNNVFLGGSDDALDLDGTDAHIEGNVFMRFHQDIPRPSTSNAIATDDNSEITVVRNLFYDNDHAILLKNGAHLIAHNNTIVGCTISAVNFSEPDRGVSPGRGAVFSGNILWDNAALFENMDLPNETRPELVINYSIIQGTNIWPGEGNSNLDPKFVDPKGDFHLKPGSPAIASGPNGVDMGAYIPEGATISGLSAEPTFQSNLVFHVGGAGITAYQYFLVSNSDIVAQRENPRGTMFPIEEPIHLNNLPDGSYQIVLRGRNSAGVWQGLGTPGEVREGNASPWNVSFALKPALSPLLNISRNSGSVRLNEVLILNRSAVAIGAEYPGLIELYNDSLNPVDLSGFTLSDNFAVPRRFVFPDRTTLAPQSYLVLMIGNHAGLQGLQTGFTLDDAGDSLYLFDRRSNGSGLLDSVTFGRQIADYSIGRTVARSGPNSGKLVWNLNKPTLGATNLAQITGDSSGLKINEWLAAGRSFFPDDFIELFNPDSVPVALDHLHLSDAPFISPFKHPLKPLSFVESKGWALFIADGNAEAGDDHLNFKLTSEQGTIGLVRSDGSLVDYVSYGPQQLEISQGRSPNGSDTFRFFQSPTPGASNPGSAAIVTNQLVNLIPMTNAWRFHASGEDLKTEWRTMHYDDSISGWSNGLALFHRNVPGFTGLTNTELAFISPQQITFYFRTRFNYFGTESNVVLELSHILDDGMILYLNGDEIYRFNMPGGDVSYSTRASSSIDEAGFFGPVRIIVTNLLAGENLLAAEVHQSSSTSRDLAFGVALDTIVPAVIGVSNSVTLNEVFARSSDTATPSLGSDWIELYNSSSTSVNLSGYLLKVQLESGNSWEFPSGTLIPAQGYLVVQFNPSLPRSATNTGFGLSAEGDGVYLFKKPSEGGELLDSIRFGIQVPSYSIGIINGTLGSWRLTIPTPQAANVEASLAQPSGLKLNEWMADPASGDDWFELYNPLPLPVDISGLFVTDDLNDRTKHPIAPLSFIGSHHQGFLKLTADDEQTSGEQHVSFKLASDGEMIGLFDSEGREIDRVRFGAQKKGVSEGRFPDGGPLIQSMPFPTPGSSNLNETPQDDADLDGMADTWELSYGLNLAANDAQLDADHDGMSNLSEYLAGTNPVAFDSRLAIQSIEAESRRVHIRFTAAAGKTYRIECQDPLLSTAWNTLTNMVAPEGVQILQARDLPLPKDGVRFYRVVIPAR